jgi:hypothetical protein
VVAIHVVITLHFHPTGALANKHNTHYLAHCEQLPRVPVMTSGLLLALWLQLALLETPTAGLAA